MRDPSPTWKRSIAAAALLTIVSGAGSLAAAEPAPPSDVVATLVPTPALRLQQLEEWVREHAAQVEPAALEVSLAKAGVTKARALPNPTLDVAWGTVPIGTTNPPDLADPLGNVPNYSVGLSYTVPLGKRGPLRERAQALEVLATHALKADVRGRALAAAEVLGELATATLRTEGLEELVSASRDFVAITAQRVNAQSAAGIDLDRLQLELARVEQAAAASRAEQAGLVSTCAAILGGRCAAFDSAQAARGFLDSWISQVPDSDDFSDRPDLAAIHAQSVAAVAETKWARALKVPDPTVRFGYLRDQFVISGNQQNSLNLSISVPLTFFDHGQAEVEAALAKREHAQSQEQRLTVATRVRLAQLRAALAQQRQRHRALQNDVLPGAHAVVDNLDAAAAHGLVPIGDVILARRTVADVLIDETESLGTTFAIALSLMAELNPQK